MRKLGLLVTMVTVFTLGASVARALPAPSLTVSMVVDRIVARPGDVIEYQIRVENRGDADALDVEVTSHVPEHTAVATDQCPEGTMEPDGDICFQPEFATPGVGDAAHQVSFGYGPLLAGEGVTFKLAVRVNDDAEPGTHLPNHAHAATPLQPDAHSPAVDTLVVGAVPQGAFGGGGVTLSGGGYTDGWDSSIGSYARTATPSDGHVASNGDISVSGGTIVNGNATPGPGKTVTISRNSVVTGSTAPAAEAFVLNDVDAEPYAAANDNWRICAAGGTCSGTTYDDAAKTLAVAGTATLAQGAYYLCSLQVSGTLRIAGAVTIWVGAPAACGGAGSVRFGSGGTVDISSGRPRDFQLRLQGGPGSSAVMTSKSAFAGVLYAPHTPMALDGGAHLFGSASVGSVAAGSGGGFIHFDRSLS